MHWLCRTVALWFNTEHDLLSFYQIFDINTPCIYFRFLFVCFDSSDNEQRNTILVRLLSFSSAIAFPACLCVPYFSILNNVTRGDSLGIICLSFNLKIFLTGDVSLVIYIYYAVKGDSTQTP